MVLVAGHGSADAPPCDLTIVCGSPAGERRSRMPRSSPARGPRPASCRLGLHQRAHPRCRRPARLPHRRNPAPRARLRDYTPLATRPPTKSLAHESPTLSDRAAGRIGHRATPRAAFAGRIARPSAVSGSHLARTRDRGAGFPHRGLGSHRPRGGTQAEENSGIVQQGQLLRGNSTACP